MAAKQLKRKPSYAEEQRAFMQRLQDERQALCRKLDRKAFDAYIAAQVARHTTA